MAAAAYRSGDVLTNEWDGITHDYSKKHWIEHQEILLPPNAPDTFKDRSVLWNAVEKAEKSGNAQLAREVEIALPIELSPDEQRQLVRSYIEENFVSKGMCADFAIHNPPLTDAKGRPLDLNGNPTTDKEQMIFQNPHAHILLTMRPLDREGNWEPKSRTVYLCRREKEERSFSAGEIKEAEAQGWKKQYSYKIGRKKVWLTKESGEKLGLKRVNKQPRTRKEQNPVIHEWNARDSVFLWRERWASACNEALERNGLDVRIDHRSYEEQGKNRLPQTHLGPQLWQMEKQGISTDKGELNRQIRRNNRFFKTFEQQIKEAEAKEQEYLDKIAARLEGLRARAIAVAYEKLSLSSLLRAAQNQEMDEITRAAVFAKSMEQVLTALDRLWKEQEQLKNRLAACGPLERRHKEELKEKIMQNEERIDALKQRRKALYKSCRPYPKGRQISPEVMQKWQERLETVRVELEEINQEFMQIIQENREYVKQFRDLCYGKRKDYTEQTKAKLIEHYKEKFSAEIWRKSQEQAPDFPISELERIKREKIHRR